MSAETLAVTWGALLGVLLIGYAILDGFDLGVGILHPFVARTDRERRIVMNSIGPLWDGNEVWLVTFGGALFAAFPAAYASAFSAFYLPFMALLFALIFRAVSLEFRSKVEAPAWRRTWDHGFFGGSLLATFLFGVAVGNTMQGIALDAAGDYTGSLRELLGPYPLLVGCFAVALFTMHGAIFLYIKTEGGLQERVHSWVRGSFFVFAGVYALTSLATWRFVPEAVDNFRHVPWLWIVPVLNALAVANIPRAIHLRRPGYAFLSSSATIAALVSLFAVALFPNLVRSAPDAAHSLTLFNAASSPRTLGIMLIIAGCGMPFVLAYTAIIYRTYRGKVVLSDHSY
jgi:cytochrome d ubiquinol oxidase subunit II